MQLKSLKNNSIHISEGNPEKCMLYRYGVLAKDETIESNDFCIRKIYKSAFNEI